MTNEQIEAARIYIRDWCPDHVKDYISALEAAQPAGAVKTLREALELIVQNDTSASATFVARRSLSALEHAAPAAEPVATLKAHIHRLIYAGDQFAAFDDTQTRDTADAWVNDRARWKVVRDEAERIALPAAPKHGCDQ